jgi:replication factor C subunit 2/4
MLTEKYRPSCINDLVLNKGQRDQIQKIIDKRFCTNIIMTGPPGTGKTTTAYFIVKTLLGPYFNDSSCMLELNASDDRGIKTVQERIAYFCKTLIDIKSEHEGIYSVKKIVLLDEADKLTEKAQKLINKIMDENDDKVFFIFTCNNSNDIIESIQSRSTIIKYTYISAQQIYDKLCYICNNEKIQYTDNGLRDIVYISDGDLRKAIHTLQVINQSFDIITENNVYKLCEKPKPYIIKNIIIFCFKKDLKLAFKETKHLLELGYSALDICLSMNNLLLTYSYLIKLNDISNYFNTEYIKHSAKYLELISNSMMIITQGLDTPTQLYGLIAELCF